MQFADTAQDVTRVTDEAIAEADALLAGIVASAEQPSWALVMAPLDEITDVIARAYGRAAFVGQVHDDPQVRDAGRAAGERMEQWGLAMSFRDDLAAAVAAFAETDEAAALTGEHARLLTFVQRDLRRAGHGLEPEARRELETLQGRLVEIGVAFQRNLSEHEDALVVTAAELDGLPSAYVESLPAGPDEGSYRVTMAYPHVLPFMDRARRRDLRQDLDRRFHNRAYEANRPLLEEAIAARHRVAALFDQPSWAHHRLEERMAAHPDAVEAFYADLVPPLTAAAEAELATLQQMLAQETGDPDAVVQRWDWRYLHTRLQQEQHGVDGALVAAHLPLDEAIAGMFALCGDVFGLDHVPVELPVWNADVRSYEVRDRATGAFIAHVHMDLFPREGTFGHAAAFTLVPGRRLPDGSYQHPTSAIVANFTPPSGGRPSLLTHRELETLFHEYGHILHQVLTTAELSRFSGTSVERDFVEAPSQIMQHWTWKPDILATFARHHETGEPLPRELVDALVAARNLDIAIHQLRQVQFGWLDLQLHGPDASTLDLEAVTRDAVELTGMPKPTDTFFPTTFAHIMGGYDAGYYGYMWAEVIGDDLFRRFEEEGVTSPAVGADYRREVLEPGGTRDAAEHVRAFLGREPDNTAFLRKLGIA